jgi:(p)ppGpp synthase/HD superfamily hydrolase
MMILRETTPQIKHMLQVITQRHVWEKRQTYNFGLPYTHHLVGAYQVFLEYQHLLAEARISLEKAQLVGVAVLGHDLYEDTDAKRKEIVEAFGPFVDGLIFSVTDEMFDAVTGQKHSRRVRHALTRPKTRNFEDGLGVFVKLCDGLDHARAGGSLIGMYRSELEQKKRDLYTPGQWEPMWAEYENLLLAGDREEMRA